MNVLYNFIKAPDEGGSIHVESFVKSFRELGDTIHENAFSVRPYLGGKENWSIAKRMFIKILWISDNFRFLWRTFWLASNTRPDVIIFRFQPSHEFALAIIFLSRLYTVLLEINAVRSIEHFEGRPRVSDLLDKICIRSASRSFVVSQRLLEHIVEQCSAFPARLAVIENGVDVDKFKPSTDREALKHELGITGRFVLGFVGSFRIWHGIEHLIELAANLESRLPSLLIMMVGDGPDRRRYEQQANERGLGNLFLFTGRVAHSDVPRYLGAMDVVLAPILNAGFAGEFHGSPLKVFEYMAMALPVIAPPLGQLKHIITDNISGRLVDSEDTERVALAVLDFYQNPALRSRIGFEARRRVEKDYTWHANANKVRNLCLDAMRRKSR